MKICQNKILFSSEELYYHKFCRYSILKLISKFDYLQFSQPPKCRTYVSTKTVFFSEGVVGLAN